MYNFLLKTRIIYLLRFLNNFYYYFLNKSYYYEVKKTAIIYYNKLVNEIKNNNSIASLMEQYIQKTWEEQLKTINFSNGIPFDYLMLSLSRRMFYKSVSQIKLYQQDVERRNLSIEKNKFINFKEPKYGLLFGIHQNVNLFEVKNISPNTAVMLYYIAILEKNFDLSKILNIVEFGGGYGNLAYLFKILSDKITYLIFDLPEILTLQYCFLCGVLGKENISIYNGTIQKEKINLIPVYEINKLELNIDLFISTFALTESSINCQKDIASKKFFNSKNLYIVGHEPEEENKQWDSIDYIKKIIKKQFINFIIEPYPQKDCFHLIAKR